MRVLIVDDDEITLELIGAMLRRRGYQVDATTDARQALTLLAAGHHRIVISDWEMPEMSGPELCTAIKATDFGEYVYTILLTGRSTRSDSAKGMLAGADDFIIKPVKPDELAARMKVAEENLALRERNVA